MTATPDKSDVETTEQPTPAPEDETQRTSERVAPAKKPDERTSQWPPPGWPHH